MSTDIEKLLAAPGLESTAFPPNSRYHGVPTTLSKTLVGETVVHLTRRFVPPPEDFSLLQIHTVAERERLDNIAYTYLGDSEQFWRLCDANVAFRPDELTDAPGNEIRITLPQGIPGSTDA